MITRKEKEAAFSKSNQCMYPDTNIAPKCSWSNDILRERHQNPMTFDYPQIAGTPARSNSQDCPHDANTDATPMWT